MTEKAYKIVHTDTHTKYDWANGSEVLTITEDILADIDPEFEAWNVEECIQILIDLDYTIFTREIKDSEKAINKHNFLL